MPASVNPLAAREQSVDSGHPERRGSHQQRRHAARDVVCSQDQAPIAKIQDEDARKKRIDELPALRNIISAPPARES